MPVADFKTYCAILDRARDARYALPAVNVTSLTTANAVLRGLAESKADGEVGRKKDYDPRTYLGLAEAAMAAHVKQAVTDLRGNGKTILK
jgi:fructose/tagatose bisphosphate aldolase